MFNVEQAYHLAGHWRYAVSGTRPGRERLVAERLTLSVEEAAHVLGIGRGLAYELARTGQIPVVRLGRRMVVPRAQLEAMLTSGGAGEADAN